jgi:hypothetical protein
MVRSRNGRFGAFALCTPFEVTRKWLDDELYAADPELGNMHYLEAQPLRLSGPSAVLGYCDDLAYLEAQALRLSGPSAVLGYCDDLASGVHDLFLDPRGKRLVGHETRRKRKPERGKSGEHTYEGISEPGVQV